jgi:ABC-type antimicrobial peptide transport system permease subunit
VALPPGIGLGWVWAQLLARFYESDLYRWPLEISLAAVAKTALIILAFIVVTNLAVRRRLRHLDPVTVLKAPE